jgi:hypothetical protein
MQSQFDDYLDKTEKPLTSLTERELAAWRAEAAAHLETLYQVEREQGHSEAEAHQRALLRFGSPEVLGQAMEQEARLVWTGRVRQEVARRLLGAALIPLLASALLTQFQLSPENGVVILQQTPIPFRDWPLALMFLGGLAGAGYQAVTNRRFLRTLVAGGLGALCCGAPLLLIMLLFQSVSHYFPKWEVGGFYILHLIALLPAAGFLFAAWGAALGTKPGRAAWGSGLFTLLTYVLFQLRDCFLSPELWSRWPSLLVNAVVVFVLPAVFLGGLYALITPLAERLVQWLWARLRRAAPRYRQRL